MKPWQIIQALESDNSRLAKEDILKKHLIDESFQEGLVLALSPYITFGVKQVPIKNDTGESGVGLSWTEFKELAARLSDRSLTGHAARDAIEDAMNKSLTSVWNDWYRRILIKDLRCGVSEKTVNKAASDICIPFSVPVFGCMLAHDSAKHEKKLVGDCFIEFKYDGVRVIAIVQNAVATLYSRNGKVLTNFPHIEAALSKQEFNGLVFDGEVMSENFQALMKQVHRKEGAQTADAYLALFDMIPLEEFSRGVSTHTAATRRHWLEAVVPLLDKCIRVVDIIRADLDTDAGQKKFKEANKLALELGYEGLMIKPADALYECKRSAAWLKLKPYIEVTLEVIDVEEGTGRNEGRLGALICEGVDDGKSIKVNVGSGFSDSDRDEYWSDRNSIIGSLVEVRADAITQNQDGTYSLRFPRFKTFRGFEKGEKL